MPKKSKQKPIPEAEVAEVRKIAEKAATQVIAQYEGPIPPAGQIQQYERTLPGAANRIIKMAEDALKAEIRGGYMDRFGALLNLILDRGFLYFLVIIAVYLLLNGYRVEALLAGLVPIVASVYSSFKKKR